MRKQRFRSERREERRDREDRNRGLALPRARGVYALLVEVSEDVELELGRKRALVPRGLHVYVGSALGPGGLRARISRHLRKEKKEKWHIDKLLSRADIVLAETGERAECSIVEALLDRGFRAPVEGFGSSDCGKCPAHLLKAPDRIAECIRALIEVFSSISLEPKIIILESRKI